MTTEHRPRVLVVEADPGLRRGLTRWLALEGYTVEGTADRAEALEWLLRCHRPAEAYSVVVLSLWLPAGSGLDVLRYVREHDIPSPVIAIDASCERLALARALGAVATLVKPFAAQQFVDLVARYARPGETGG